VERGQGLTALEADPQGLQVNRWMLPPGKRLRQQAELAEHPD
jgi:hypothetical protein